LEFSDASYAPFVGIFFFFGGLTALTLKPKTPRKINHGSSDFFAILKPASLRAPKAPTEKNQPAYMHPPKARKTRPPVGTHPPTDATQTSARQLNFMV